MFCVRTYGKHAEHTQVMRGNLWKRKKHIDFVLAYKKRNANTGATWEPMEHAMNTLVFNVNLLKTK